MAGIYMIENKINGKRYIGQSWDVRQRLNEHKCKEKNNHLKSAFLKYGIENFEFRILCELKEEEQNQERLNDLEIAYIDILETANHEKGYNNMSGGSRGKHSEESKKLMSELKKGKPVPWVKGIKRSVESRKKQSVTNKGKPSGMKGKKKSIYSVYKSAFGKMGYKAEFELETPGTKTFIGERI